MSALGDYRILWQAAVSQRRPKQVAIARRVTLVVMLLVGGIAALMTGDWAATLDYGLRVPFAVLMYLLVVLFVPGATLLNTPINARLAPRVRARLMQMTGLGWTLAAGIPALVLGTSAGNALAWFLAIAAWMIGFGLARGGYWLGTALQTAVVLGALSVSEDLALWDSAAVLALATALVLALGAGALNAIFPRGGERHWKLRGKIERAAERATADGQFKSGEAWRFGAGLYGAVLRHDSARRRASALLLHVLGPATHWTQLCLPLGVLLALAVAAKLLFAAYASAALIDTAAGIGWVIWIGLMLMQQINLERVSVRLATTPAEQALLRMAPLSAPASSFNRQLGRALLRYALLDWAALTAVVMCLTALSGASGYILVMQACLCCLGLPLVAAPLRDHARRTGMMGWWLFLGGIGAALLSAAAGLLASRLLGLPGWPVMALASAVIAVLVVGLRWRAMDAAPVAFPVGRLA